MKNLLFITGLLALNALTFSAHGDEIIALKETSFHFEIVGLYEPLEHTFHFKNKGKTELQITNVVTASPLRFKGATSKIAPGKDGSVTVSLEMPRVFGDYAGEVVVQFNDANSLTFPVTGKIMAPIQILPIPAFFVSTQRGFENAASIEIIGNEKEPLQILSVQHESDRFKTRLKTLEEGRRYQLTLTLKGEGKTGRVTEQIIILTSSAKQPRLVISANTLVKDRVYTFPDKIDLGTVKLEELKNHPDLVEYLAQTLMVYQIGGTNLDVRAETSLPFVKVSAENSDLKDRSQVKIEVLLEKMKVGKIESTIGLSVNDPEFSRLEVPFTATIEN